MSTLGNNIKERRKALGLSQTALAKLIPGLSTHTPISKIELGETRPDERMLSALAAALKTTPEELVGKPIRLLVIEEEHDPIQILLEGDIEGETWLARLDRHVTEAGKKAIFRLGSILQETFDFERGELDYFTGFHEVAKLILDAEPGMEPLLERTEAESFLRRLYDHNAIDPVRAEMRTLLEARRTRSQLRRIEQAILDRFSGIEARLQNLEAKIRG